MRAGLLISGVFWVSVISTVLVCSGCALFQADYMQVGTERGIRAHNDGQIGLATSREPMYYHKQRNLQETESTARYMKPSFLSGLFSKSAPEAK